MNLAKARLGMVIVDLQNDFLAPDGAYARGQTVSAEALLLPERMAPVASAIKARGGLICASQFTLWPNAQGEPMISEHLRERRPFLRRGDFAPGSRGQANVDVKRLEVGLQGVSDKGVELRTIAYVRGKGEAARSFRQEATLAMLSLARELGLKIMTEA